MNRFTMLGLIVFFLATISYMADALDLGTPPDVASSVQTDIAPKKASVIGAMSMFFKILTFQLEGVPAMLNMIFLVPTAIVLYIIIDIIKDLVPLT
jgi:hypothetical protein